MQSKQHVEYLPAWWNGRHKRLKISGLSRPCRFESGRGYHVLGNYLLKATTRFFIGENGTQKETKRNSFSRVKSVRSEKRFVSLSRLNRYFEHPAMISTRVTFQSSKARTWQHRSGASAIRLTTGLGSGCMWRDDGWGRVP